MKYAYDVYSVVLCYFTQDVSMEVYNPRNTQAVELYFRGEKMAKVIHC